MFFMSIFINLFKRIKLLPVLIFFAAIMLSLRVEVIRKNISVSLEETSATAQEKTEEKSAEKKEDSKEEQKEAKDEKKDDPKKVEKKELTAFDPASLTPQDIEMLNNMKNRSDALASSEKKLTEREQTIKVAEAKLNSKVAELEKIKAQLGAMQKQLEEKEEKNMMSVVAIYEKMKPKEASKILSGLNVPDALSILERLKQDRAAVILSNMDAAKAQTLTQFLIERKKASPPAA